MVTDFRLPRLMISFVLAPVEANMVAGSVADLAVESKPDMFEEAERSSE
jgi:hypothetical protein